MDVYKNVLIPAAVTRKEGPLPMPGQPTDCGVFRGADKLMIPLVREKKAILEARCRGRERPEWKREDGGVRTDTVTATGHNVKPPT